VRRRPSAARLPVPDRLPFALALRRRPRLRRALAVVTAVAVAVAVASTVQRAEAARAAWGRSRPVVVAARDLAPGEALAPGDTQVVRYPEPLVPDDALVQVAEGRVVRAAAFDGQVLLARHVADAGLEGPAALVPPGARAVAVPVEPGAAPPLSVGQSVDVVAVVGVDGAPQAVVLAAGAPVVAVGDRAASVAIRRDTVPRVAAALASGSVTLALVGRAGRRAVSGRR
jgi:pilus assembly protein CpaB